MSEKNLLIKRVNISTFKDFTTYEWVHSECYNIFELFLISTALKKISPQGKFAIDIGCGPGLVLLEMRTLYEYSVGVDLSSGMLRRAKSYLGAKEKRRVDLLCADIEYMPFRSSVFDTAAMYSVLHHLPNLDGSLKEINRIMTSKSPLILFHEPHEMRIRSIFEKTLIRILWYVREVFWRSIYKRKWQDFRHERQLRRFTKLGKLEALADVHAPKGFSFSEMKMLMAGNGFEVVRIKTRIQSFMATFSRLFWPFKSLAVLDFVLSRVPVLNNYLPLLFCVARKQT